MAAHLYGRTLDNIPTAAGGLVHGTDGGCLNVGDFLQRSLMAQVISLSGSTFTPSVICPVQKGGTHDRTKRVLPNVIDDEQDDKDEKSRPH
jgi:hypothetical protein